MKYVTASLLFILTFAALPARVLGDDVISFFSPFPDTTDFPATNLHNHFTAKQGLITDGNRVTEWRDQSGNGYHVTVPVDKDPAFTGPRIDLETMNGFSVPKWLENSGMRLERDSFSPDPPLPTANVNMYYAVIKAPHAQGTWRFFWDAVSAYARQPLYTTYSDGRWWVRNGSNFTYVTVPDNEWVIVTIRYRNSSASDQGAQVYVNGVLVSDNPNSVRMSGGDGIRFGSAGNLSEERPPFSSTEGEFAMAERLHYDGDHTEEERRQVEHYLSTEWGVALDPVIKPVITSPALGTENVGFTPELQWTMDNGDTEFELVLGTEFNFLSDVLIDTVVMGKAFQVPSGVLSNNTEYWWKVRSANPDHTAWSQMGAGLYQTGGFAFKTGSEPSEPPGTATLLSPADGSTDVSTDPVLSWQAVDQATGYRVQVATDTGFSSPVVDEANLTATDFAVTGLDVATVYYWRVMATNAIGDGPWSSSWAFTTVNSGAASAMSVTQQPVAVTAGAAISPAPAVTVTDGTNPVNGVTVTASLNGAALTAGSTTSAVTDVNGVASFANLVTQAAGTGYTLSFDADAAGVANVDSDPFDVSPAAASTLIEISGNGQSGPISTALAEAFVVEVQDAFGNPVSGETVDFSIQTTPASATGQSLSTLSTATDAAGRAASTLTLGNTAGAYGVDAVWNATTISFTATAESGAAAALQVNTQPGATTAGQTIAGPPSVLVTDSGGNPVSGVTVSVSESGGYAFDEGTLMADSDGSGVAAFSDLVINTAGNYTLEFSSGGLSTISSNAFDVTAAAASGLAVASGNDQSALISQALAQDLTAEVADAFGNPVAGVTVDFAISSVPAGSVGESLSSASAVTDATGQASVSLTLGDKVGDYIVEASSVGLTMVQFTATATTGDPSTMSVTTEASLSTAGQAIAGPPSVTVIDAGSNPVSGVNVTVSESGGYIMDGGTLTVATNASGVAEFSDLIIETAGDYTLLFNADATGVANVTSGSFTVQSAAASSIEITTIASPQTAGTPFSVTLTALDAFGNVDDSFAETADLTTTAGTVSPATAAFAGGTVTLDVSVTQSGTGRTITAIAGSVMGTSNGFDVNPGAVSAPGSSVTATSPHTADGSDASTVTIAVQDANGNAVAGLAGTDFGVDLGVSSAVAGTVAETATPGTYRVSVTNTIAEEVTVSVTADGVALEDSPVIDFQAGAVSRLTIVEQPSVGTAGVALSPAPAVQVSDGTNPVEGVTVDVALEGASFDGGSVTSAASDASGNAVFPDLVIDTAGSGYTLRFSSAGLSDVISAGFDVTPAVADAASSTATVPAGTAGQATDLSIFVKDSFGNPVSGEAGNLSVSVTGDNSASPAVSETAVAGEYTASYTPTVSGTDNVAITLGLDAISGSPYTSTVSAGAASDMTVTQQPILTTAGAAISPAPSVTVTDGTNPVSGVTVTASLNGAALTVGSTTSSVTDVNGIAAFSNLITEPAGTGYKLTFDADAAGVANVDSDPFDVTAATASVVVGISGNGQTGQISTALAAPFEVEVRDAFDNPVAGETVGFSIESFPVGAAGQSLSTLSITTDAAGRATSTLTLGNTVGPYAVDAVWNASTTSFTATAESGGSSAIQMNTQPAVTTAGQTIAGPPSVLVTDSGGNPVSGVTVSVSESGGYAFDEGTLTADSDGSGVAAFSDLVIYTAGNYSINFSSPGLTTISSNTFNVNPGAVSASVSTVTATSPHTADGADASTVTIAVQDGNGNAVAGLASGDFNVGLSGSAATDRNVTETGTPGSYSVGVTNTVAESVTVTITADGVILEDTPVVEFQAGPVTRLTIVEQPTVTTAGAAISPAPAVTVTDGTNPVSGLTVDVALTGAAFAAGSTTSVTTDGSGAAAFSSLLIETTGSGYTLTFSSAGLSDVTSGEFAVNPAAADPASTTATVPDGTAGATTTITVNVADAFGNAVTGEAANLAASVSGGPNAGAAVSEFSDDGGGSYTAGYTPVATGDDQITITLNTTGISGSPYMSTVSAGTAASFSFDTITSPQTAGTDFGITITALDANSNTADAYNGTATLATMAGAIAPATASFTSGVATVSVNVTGAGADQTISAEDGAVTGLSNTFTVNPGAVSASGSSVTATSPHTADGADASTVTIVVRDANGNTITGLTDTAFSVDLGVSSAVAGPVAETATAGTYRVGVTNTVAEAVTVTVSVGGVALEDTPVIDFQAGAVSRLSIVRQPPGATAGVALSPAPAVQVTDGTNPVEGVSVEVSLEGAVFAGGSTTLATSNSNGDAEFTNLVVETAGTGYTLRFSSAGMSDVISEGFDVSAAAGDPALTTATVLDGRAGQATDLTILVNDSFGNPVSGVAGSLAVSVSGSNTAAPVVSETAAAGQYRASYTPGVAGTDNVAITLGGAAIAGSPYTSIVGAGAVSLMSPSDGSVDVNVDAILRWNALEGATNYRVQMAEDVEFMTLFSDEAGLTDTEYSPAALSYETTYYWRVLASNDAGNLGWSEVWSFRTEPEPISPPGVVSLLSPSNDSVDVPLDGLLSWQTVAQGTDYRVQVSTDAGFTTIVEEQAGLSVSEYRPVTLDFSTMYFWRVRAGNGAGEGDWSGIWSFQTVSTLLAETKIESVYPNPLNPTANIKYQLAENSEVLIEVFDMTGKRITVLINARQSRGAYTIPFSASGFSSGIYFVRLRAGNTVSTEKFTIIK